MRSAGVPGEPRDPGGVGVPVRLDQVSATLEAALREAPADRDGTRRACTATERKQYAASLAPNGEVTIVRRIAGGGIVPVVCEPEGAEWHAAIVRRSLDEDGTV